MALYASIKYNPYCCTGWYQGSCVGRRAPSCNHVPWNHRCYNSGKINIYFTIAINKTPPWQPYDNLGPF